MSLDNITHVNDLPAPLSRLVAAALQARENAYAPYSGFAVGAALATTSGAVFAGCNIENAAYGAALCAERAALASAIVAGERTFRHIAIVADVAEPLCPCGICRQVLSEMAPEIVVVMSNTAGQVRIAPIGDLLPLPFGASLNTSTPSHDA